MRHLLSIFLCLSPASLIHGLPIVSLTCQDGVNPCPSTSPNDDSLVARALSASSIDVSRINSLSLPPPTTLSTSTNNGGDNGSSTQFKTPNDIAAIGNSPQLGAAITANAGSINPAAFSMSPSLSSAPPQSSLSSLSTQPIGLAMPSSAFDGLSLASTPPSGSENFSPGDFTLNPSVLNSIDSTSSGSTPFYSFGCPPTECLPFLDVIGNNPLFGGGDADTIGGVSMGVPSSSNTDTTDPGSTSIPGGSSSVSGDSYDGGSGDSGVWSPAPQQPVNMVPGSSSSTPYLGSDGDDGNSGDVQTGNGLFVGEPSNDGNPSSNFSGNVGGSNDGSSPSNDGSSLSNDGSSPSNDGSSSNNGMPLLLTQPESNLSPDDGSNGTSNSGNSGNTGSGNSGNIGSGNSGNIGNGNSGNIGSGNSGNIGGGNSGNTGSGNSGNTGSGNNGGGNSGGSPSFNPQQGFNGSNPPTPGSGSINPSSCSVISDGVLASDCAILG